VDCGEEVAFGLVIAGCDGSKLLEFTEEVLDEMTGLVEVFVVVAVILPIALGRDDRRFAGCGERFDDALVGVEGLVGDHGIGFDGGKKRISAVEIMGLARRQVEAGRIAEGIDGGVDLGAGLSDFLCVRRLSVMGARSAL
jgi:hypothetical protein